METIDFTGVDPEGIDGQYIREVREHSGVNVSTIREFVAAERAAFAESEQFVAVNREAVVDLLDNWGRNVKFLDQMISIIETIAVSSLGEEAINYESIDWTPFQKNYPELVDSPESLKRIIYLFELVSQKTNTQHFFGVAGLDRIPRR